MNEAAPIDPGWGLYVHVPFCRVRCPYCAFYIVPTHAHADVRARFVDRVIGMYADRRGAFPGPPSTIYLGGGTPTQLPTEDLERLLRAIVPAGALEVTLEANPEDLRPELVERWRAAGLTRVSLGAQTFQPEHARRLGRSANPGRAAAALAWLPALVDVSIDLMFGLHAQTLADLDADLDVVIAAGLHHVSVYGLTVEPGTGYARAEARGALAPADDELWREMYARLVERLRAGGLLRYEVSNFARPGHEARHNQGYWTGRPYLGIGPGAHGLLPDGRRTADVPDLARWLTEDDVTTIEQPDPEQAAIDTLVGAVRTVAGVDLRRLRARTGLAPRPAVLHELARAGLIHVQEDRLVLTEQGFFLADGVTASLARALRPAVGPETC
jgi:oxygen-independent coproporphyrinogen-3 oxidase